MNKSLPMVIANLKANKTWEEVSYWIDEVAKVAASFKGTIILCPSAPFLAAASLKLKSNDIKIELGSQDISKFDAGAYTGEFAASQIKDLCAYVMIGHSERTKYFGESREDAIAKLELILKTSMTPIFCLPDYQTFKEDIKKSPTLTSEASKIIFVSEPPSAISAGGDYHPDDPENANMQAAKIKDEVGKDTPVLYGGSINPQNAKSFFAQDNINGGLVGQASLDPSTFVQILESF